MCDISGIFDWNSLKNAEKVASIMKDSQDHRGPDFNSTYRDDNIIISHNRLSIIDLDPQSNQQIIVIQKIWFNLIMELLL